MNARRLLLPAALVLLAAGCGPSKQELAKQIVIERVEIRPYTDDKGRPYQAASAFIKNNSDRSIGSVFCRITAYDANNAVIETDVFENYCVFASAKPSDKIPPGGRGHNNGVGKILDGIQEGRPAAHVEMVPVEADTLSLEEQH